MAMASAYACNLQPFFLSSTLTFSRQKARCALSPRHSHSSPCKHNFHGVSTRLSPSFRCLGVRDTDLEPSSTASTLPSESTVTESEKAANAVGQGSSFVIFYSDHIPVPIPAGCGLPVDKFQTTRLFLEQDTSLSNLLVTRPSPLASHEELCLVYEERHVEKILNGDLTGTEIHGLDTFWSTELVTRSCASTGGSVAAMHIVMLGLRMAAGSISGCTDPNSSGRAGGDYMVPSGVFNDIAVAASVALQAYPNFCNEEKPILVINLDARQNNVAKFFAQDKRVVFFNMYGTNEVPRRAKMQSKLQSFYGMDLLDSTGDHYYLAVLNDWLQQLLDFYDPSLVFFQAGVDALLEDISGRFSMTRQGLIQRNNIVYTACLTRNIPVVITMGFGYSRPPEACFQAYADVYRTAALRYSAG